MLISTLELESTILSAQALEEKPPKTTEWITPNLAQASIVIGSSADMGMWIVTRSPRFNPAKISENRCKFIDPDIEFLIGDMINSLLLKFRNKVNGSFCFCFLQDAGQYSYSLH